MPQLDVHTYTSQIFWLVVSFAILFAVVRAMHPRLARVAGERAAKSGGDITSAERARADAAARDAALAERLAKAHDHARGELARATEAARGKSTASLSDLGHRLAARAAEAEAALGSARARAEAELAETARVLTADLVHRFTDAIPAPERLDAALQASRP